jgi:hypothetical protein
VARRERVIGYLVGIVVVVLLYALAYQVVMATFQDQQVSFTAALLVVVETSTTTGYGEDAQFWVGPEVQILLIAMQITGVTAVFLALPVFAAPWIESRLSETAPLAADGLAEHVVVAGYTSRVDALIDEFSALDRPYVVIEPNRELANELYSGTEMNVIHGDPEFEETLSAAGIEDARPLVCDVDDETNASISLAARGMDVDDLELITFVEDPHIARYHRYAGADDVFSPRHLIGESLAKKVTAGVTPELDGGIGDRRQADRRRGRPRAGGVEHRRRVVPWRVRLTTPAGRPHRRADHPRRRRSRAPARVAEGADPLRAPSPGRRSRPRRRVRRGGDDRHGAHRGRDRDGRRRPPRQAGCRRRR